jgi:hypothetical protein
MEMEWTLNTSANSPVVIMSSAGARCTAHGARCTAHGAGARRTAHGARFTTNRQPSRASVLIARVLLSTVDVYKLCLRKMTLIGTPVKPQLGRVFAAADRIRARPQSWV